jgi:hypothetical protein
LSDPDLTARAHLNMLGFFRVSADHADAGALEEADGAILVRLGAQLPFLNCVIPVDTVGDPARLLDRAESFFAGRSAGWVVVTREGAAGDDALRAACDERGLAFQERYPEMVCEQPIDEPEPAPGCELRRVDDERSARTYWDLCNGSYPTLGFPPDTFTSFPESLLLDPQTSAFIAHRDGEPVACALGWLDADTGMVFIGWVATVDAARRTGLGALCTIRATDDGFERGARAASLQASPMGYPVYDRLGYREIANYNVHTRR